MAVHELQRTTPAIAEKPYLFAAKPARLPFSPRLLQPLQRVRGKYLSHYLY
jgi:hypothetical protein